MLRQGYWNWFMYCCWYFFQLSYKGRRHCSQTCCKVCVYCRQVQCVVNQLQYNSLRALCTTTFLLLPDRCNPWSHKPAIVVMTSFSLWHPRTYGTRSPRSHYDVILIMTSFTAGHAQRYGRTCVTYVRTPCCVYYIKITTVWWPFFPR